MGGRKRGSRNLSLVKVREGFAAWLRLGTADEAAAVVGIDADSIRSSKRHHPEIWQEVARAHLEALSQQRAAIAGETIAGLRESVLVTRKLLRSDLQRASGAAQAAAAITRALSSVDLNLDRIGRLDAGGPTDITMLQQDSRSDAELLADLRSALGEAPR